MSDLIEVPEGSRFYQQALVDEKTDWGEAFAVSVHAHGFFGQHSVCNAWRRSQGKWVKILPERVVHNRRPTPRLLVGEIHRIASLEDVLFARFQPCFLHLQDKALSLCEEVEAKDWFLGLKRWILFTWFDRI